MAVRGSDSLNLREGVHAQPNAYGFAPLALAYPIHQHHILR